MTNPKPDDTPDVEKMIDYQVAQAEARDQIGLDSSPNRILAERMRGLVPSTDRPDGSR